MLSKFATVVAAVIVPCVAYGGIVAIDARAPEMIPDYLESVMAITLCVAGFLLLSGKFRQRGLVAVVYFPVMVVLYFYVAVNVVMRWFGGP